MRAIPWGKLLLLLVLAILASPQLWYPLGFDQAVYAACGDVIRRGGWPIQDCFETKQAGVMVMYAIPMFLLQSLSPMVIHAFTLMWTAATAVVIGQVAGRMFQPSAAWPAAIFYWLAYAGINYWSMDQAETYSNLFLVIALFGVWKTGVDRPAWKWLMVSGLCVGITFWFKYVFGLYGIVLALCLFTHLWIKTRSFTAAFKQVLVFGMAALGTAALGLLAYVLANALPALVSQFQFLQAAFPLGPPRTFAEIIGQLLRFINNGADVTGDFKDTVPQWIILGGGFPVFFVLAFLGAWLSFQRAPMIYVYLGAHFITGAAIVAWQANYIQYHYTILIPPVVLAASAVGFEFRSNGHGALRLGVRRLTGSVLVVLTVVLLGVRMLPWLDDAFQNVVVRSKSLHVLYQESRVAPNVPTAEYIASHTQPGDTIAIFGDAPWVYTLADRHNATRFSFVNLWLRKREAITYPLFTQQYLDGLVRNQPVYFVLTKPDFPWPNNDYIPDYKAATAIYGYVESHYAYEGENGPFLLYRRKQ